MIAPILRPRQVVLYLGDLDLSGGQIEQNSRKILEDILVKLAWERLAITQEQVDQYELEPIQKWDERLHEYHPAVETEAIGQSLIVVLVIDRLNVLLPEPLKAVLARQAAQIQAMDTRIRRMKDVIAMTNVTNVGGIAVHEPGDFCIRLPTRATRSAARLIPQQGDRRPLVRWK